MRNTVLVLRNFLSISSLAGSSSAVVVSGKVSSQLLSNIAVTSCQSTTTKMVHTKCRAEFYSYKKADNTIEKVARQLISDDQVPWNVLVEDYSPPELTAPFVLSAAWADPQQGADGFTPTWNAVDGNVNRQSHAGCYTVSEEGRPLNPGGRTGLAGRGVLGKWGPNHAADPIVTRWSRDGNGDTVTDPGSGRPVLEFVSIQRRDTGDWAIPGGMVDPGEKVSVTVKREFMEEALDSTGINKDNVDQLKEMVDGFFSCGEEVFAGYVDDPRNTDNAWMETVAFHFHDDTGDKVGQFPLVAGDDAAKIRWMALHAGVSLYASHKDMIKIVVDRLKAHW